MRTTDDYSIAISGLLQGRDVQVIYYGIGYPSSSHKRKAKESTELVDFIVGIDDDETVQILYSKEVIF